MRHWRWNDPSISVCVPSVPELGLSAAAHIGQRRGTESGDHFAASWPPGPSVPSVSVFRPTTGPTHLHVSVTRGTETTTASCKRQLRESIQLAKLFWGRTLAHFNQASLSTDDGVGGLVPHCSASRDSSPCACVPVGTRHALPFRCAIHDGRSKWRALCLMARCGRVHAWFLEAWL